MMVIIAQLVFMNFIIAEVSNSYTKVNEKINAFVYKDRAALVSEAEDLAGTYKKENDKEKFPTYIITRMADD